MELTTLIGRCESQSEEKKKGRGWVKGMPKSEAHKRKISESLKGKMAGSLHPLFGKHPSEESKKRMSESKKGIKNVNFGRTIKSWPEFEAWAEVSDQLNPA